MGFMCAVSLIFIAVLSFEPSGILSLNLIYLFEGPTYRWQYKQVKPNSITIMDLVKFISLSF